jgi:peroxiredoxin Q/BCP
LGKGTSRLLLKPGVFPYEQNGGVMLKVGEKAPDFSLPSDSGATVSLKDFKGKTLILYFFPKADTPG